MVRLGRNGLKACLFLHSVPRKVFFVLRTVYPKQCPPPPPCVEKGACPVMSSSVSGRWEDGNSKRGAIAIYIYIGGGSAWAQRNHRGMLAARGGGSENILCTTRGGESGKRGDVYKNLFTLSFVLVMILNSFN